MSNPRALHLVILLVLVVALIVYLQG